MYPNDEVALSDLVVAFEKGLYSQAEALYLEAKNIIAQNPGKHHPEYASHLNSLAVLYQKQSEYTKAEPLYLEARDIKAKALGKKHPGYALSLNNLAGLYEDQGEYTKAEPPFFRS
ncbi:MAG: tetratricopeptide repeat protein [Microscillaceae bacterium]|nr:tetratricopeptide repeat protein [Microscillaceae bacterium]